MGLYDNLTFNQGEYIPQYAGTPLDAMQKTGDVLAGRHYQNIAQANQLQILANQMKSKLLPGAKSGVDKHIEQLDVALQDMAKSGGENSTARIFALANTLQSDQGILNATQRAAEYNKQTELIDQLTAKGEIPLYDKARREALANAAIDDEMLASPFEALVEPYRDPNPEMEDIWKVINPDSYEGELRVALNSKTGKPLATALGNEDLGMFYETITSGGISNTKIKSQLDNAWANYKNTASFKQQTGKLVGKTEDQVKKEFFAKGLTRVFNNLKRDYRNLPSSATSGMGKNVNQNIDLDLAQTVDTPKLPFSVDDITETGDVKSNITDKLAEGVGRNVFMDDPTSKSYEERVKRDLSKAKKDGNKAEISKLENELGRIQQQKTPTKKGLFGVEYPDLTKVNEEKTKAALPYYEAAAMWAEAEGANTDKMTKEQIKYWAATPEGKQKLKEYEQTVLANRYEAPYIVPETAQKDRTEQVNRLNNSLSLRYAIPFDDPNKIINLSDAITDGDDDAVEISKAFQKNKDQIRYYGDVQSTNWLGNGTDQSARFSGASVIEIPTENEGEVKRFYLSKTAGEIDGFSKNEKILTSVGNKIPGIQNKTKDDLAVFKPISNAAKLKLKNKYANLDPEIMDWDEIVEIKFKQNGIPKTKIFQNYRTAAYFLDQEGITFNSDN